MKNCLVNYDRIKIGDRVRIVRYPKYIPERWADSMRPYMGQVVTVYRMEKSIRPDGFRRFRIEEDSYRWIWSFEDIEENLDDDWLDQRLFIL